MWANVGRGSANWHHWTGSGCGATPSGYATHGWDVTPGRRLARSRFVCGRPAARPSAATGAGELARGRELRSGPGGDLVA